MTQPAQMSENTDAEKVVRRYFGAYPARDRAAIESVVADDFHFTSPIDNRIDRATYFEHCWPNAQTTAAIDLQHVVVSGEKVYVTYDARTMDGKRFRNSELLTLKEGKVSEVEVYFGWTTPHKAPPGGFVADNGDE
jgi:ketosteroid isomerase-like protein